MTEHTSGEAVPAGRGRSGPERELADVLRSWAASFPSGPGRRYGSEWEMVLDLGQWWCPAPFPAELGRHRGQARDCYRAAARLAARVEGLRYVEGFATPAGLQGRMAFGHAWCVTGQGVVVDPVWWEQEGTAYLGVPLALDYRDRVMAERPRGRRSSPAVLDARDSAHLLAEGIPAEAVASAAAEL